MHMICASCKKENETESKFCNECGAPLNSPEKRPEITVSSGKSYKVLIFCNWLVGALMLAGMVMQIIRFKDPNISSALILAVTTSFPIALICTGVLLSRKITLVFGVPIRVSANSLFPFGLLFLLNLLMFLAFGYGLYSCYVTHQIGPMFSLVPLFLLSAFNLKGMFEVRKIAKEQAA